MNVFHCPYCESTYFEDEPRCPYCLAPRPSHARDAFFADDIVYWEGRPVWWKDIYPVNTDLIYTTHT